MNILRFIIPKSQVETLSTGMSVRQALEKMRFHRYVAMAVLDEGGKYVGTLHNEDLFHYFLDSGTVDLRAAEHDGILPLLENSPPSRPLYHSATMQELIEEVKEHNFVPIVDDRGCFIGLILRRDILNYLLTYYENNEEKET